MKNSFYMETVSSSTKIDMSWMLKTGTIRRDADTHGVLSWTGHDRTVSYHSKMLGKEKYLRLFYTFRGISYNYKIKITEVPSNLGKGTILYFKCPESGRRSKTLFQAYGHPKFLNRDWYKTKYNLPIYYPGQQAGSAYDFHNNLYFYYKSKVDKLRAELNKKHRKTHYRGKLTKDQFRLFKLENTMNYHDDKRNRMFIARTREKFGDKILNNIELPQHH